MNHSFNAMHWNSRAMLAGLALSSTLAFAAPSSTVPVREIPDHEAPSYKTPYSNPVPLAQMEVKTAAWVRVEAENSTPGQAVQRRAGLTAAVYKGALYDPSLAPNATPAPPAPAGTLFNFKLTRDSVQAFATMTPEGRPYLLTQSFGHARGVAAASWQTTVSAPSTAQRDVYLDFSIPAVSLTGANEQDGPSLWRSRLRVELLINGYPAWRSESTRFNELNGSVETKRNLEVFGTSLGLDPLVHTALSPVKHVFLYLGQLDAGESMDVTMIMRADSDTPTKCGKDKIDGVYEYFCTRSTTSVQWNDALAPTTFYIH